MLLLIACATPVDRPENRVRGALDLAGPTTELVPGETAPPPPPGLCQAALTCPSAPTEVPQLCALSVVTEEGEVEYDGPARAWVRGRSSAAAPKQTFGVELVDDAGVEVSTNLLGMGAEGDWVLHGNYYDRSLVRNMLGFDLYRAMGGHAPEGGWCELTLQGAPWGVYSLFERIDADDDRLDLTADTAFIVDLDDEEYFHANVLGYGGWELQYPDEDSTGAIDAYLSGLDAAGLSAHPGSMLDWVDLDSAVDIVILEELMRNNDGWFLSLYAWRDADKLNFSPWDLDLTLGQPNYNDNENPEGWIAYRPTLPAGFAANPAFAARLPARWAELREGALADDAILARIDGYQGILGEAIDRNFAVWPIASIDFDGYLYPVSSYADEDARVRGWIPKRTGWIDENIAGW